MDLEPVPDGADRFTGGIREHAGGVDVDVTAWISENSEDLARRRGDKTRHFNARGLLFDIGHPVSMSPAAAALAEQILTIVDTDTRLARLEGIDKPHCERLSHASGDLSAVQPRHFRDLGSWLRST